MPPQQCPECGRFLRKDLIASLADGPKPCPRCEAPLSVLMFDGAPADAAPPTPVAVEPEPVAVEPEPVAVEPEPVAVAPEPVAVEPEPVAVEPEPVAVASSIPPTVGGTPLDPLVGWDPNGYEARTTDVLQAEDKTPILAAGGAASGALVGFVALGRTRSRGALLGALVGAITGLVVSRMTRPTA